MIVHNILSPLSTKGIHLYLLVGGLHDNATVVLVELDSIVNALETEKHDVL